VNAVNSGASALEIGYFPEHSLLVLEGALEVTELGRIDERVGALLPPALFPAAFTCDLSRVTSLDTAGAVWLLSFVARCDCIGCRCELLPPEGPAGALLQLVSEQYEPGNCCPKRPERNWLEAIGRSSVKRAASFLHLLGFVGQTSMIAFSYLRHIGNIRFKEITAQIHESAIGALGIICLITFLIGVVIAYQSSLQLKLYGANIFIVDMLGIGIFRELSPLLVAIVVAGRSGSAYAAQIGAMKITEELDAMRTMGFDPYAFLVLPRLIALTLMMPILIFFADISGVLGGLLVSKAELGISPSFFLERFATVVDIRHFWIGVAKGPFFALLIASIGIYRGMRVENDTRSIGFNTTKSVVSSIFAVIICDALFSIIFSNLGI